MTPSDAPGPRPPLEVMEANIQYQQSDSAGDRQGLVQERADYILELINGYRHLEAAITTLRRELAAADTSIATLSAGDRYGDGWEAGRDAVVALTRTMQQGFQSRMHEQATFAAIDGALQALIANTEDLEPGETNGR